MYIFTPMFAAVAFLAVYSLIETVAYRKLITLGKSHTPRAPMDLRGMSPVTLAATFFESWLGAMTSQQISVIDKDKIENLATTEMKRIDGVLAPYYRLRNLSRFCMHGAIFSILVFIGILFAFAAK